MRNVEERGREIVTLLEAGAVEEVLGRVAAEPRRTMEPGVLSQWGPGVEGAIGGGRSIVEADAVDERCARLLLHGDRGTLAVTVRFDEAGSIAALGVAS